MCFGFVFVLPETQREHVSSLKSVQRGKERESKEHNRSEQCSVVPASSFLPVSHSLVRLVGQQGKKWHPPAAVEMGCSVPVVEGRAPKQSEEDMVQAGPCLFYSVFLVCSSVQLNNFNFSAVFLGLLTMSLLTLPLFLYSHSQTPFACTPVLLLVVVPETLLGYAHIDKGV